jgi:gas vesicle protein
MEGEEATMREFVFFVLGVAVGAVAALMFAPSSGAELRGQIQTAAEREAGRLQSEWQDGLQKTNYRLDALQADLRSALQRAEQEAEEAAE